MLAFFRFIKFYNEGEITMVSVRKRGKVYEYRFEIATVEGTRKWITKSGYPTKAEAFKEGAKAYNDFLVTDNKSHVFHAGLQRFLLSLSKRSKELSPWNMI